MFHKVKTAQALPDMKLCIQFAEGISKIYDMSALIGSVDEFSVLRENLQLFYSVAVDTGGYGIVWNDDLDLSCDELWDNGMTIRTSFDGLLALGDASRLWNLNESTLRKAITYGKLVAGIDVCKYGKQWVVSLSAMIREYGRLDD